MTVPLMNIGGLASGLDTNAIIAGLMDVERIPIDQLEARKSGYQAKDQAWQEVTTRFSAIRSALDAVKDTSDLNSFVTAASSNASAVSATATGAAAVGAMSFTVDQLAAAHQVVSTADLGAADSLVGAGDFTITIDGQDHVVTADASTTLTGLAQAINAMDAGVDAAVLQIDDTTFKLMLTAESTGASNQFTTSATIGSLATTDVVQQGLDALLTIGSGAGALTLARSTNSITDLYQGVTIDLREASAAPVSVSVSRDTTAAAEAITTLVDEINATLTTLAGYTSYNAESETAGVLLGDGAARRLISDLRTAISGSVLSGGAYPTASSIGVSLNRNGTFDVDSAKLEQALAADFDGVVALLTRNASSSDSRVAYAGSTAATVAGDYDVVISQAATKPSALSNDYGILWWDASFQITVDANVVDVFIARWSNITQAVGAINTALTAAGVTNLAATHVQSGGDDMIQLDHTGYGSGASFTVTGDPFGLAGTYTGTDVAGTIGAEAATGSGRSLTASSGDPTGLALVISATAAEVSGAGGSLGLGTVSYSEGLLGKLDAAVDAAEGSGGSISRARDHWKAQIDIIDDRIEVFEDRIDRKEAQLIRQFAALETAMAQLVSQSDWLTSQLASLNGATGQ